MAGGLTDLLKRENQFHIAYMNIAYVVASLSYITKRKVGAVIVNGRNIAGYGFNGAVNGLPNIGEDDNAEGKDVHAEMNALIKAGQLCKGADIYVTCYPCELCARHLAQAGIKRVFYAEDHHNNVGQVDLYGMYATKIELPAPGV